MAYSLNSVDKASKDHREHNDCAVKALALTTKLSYADAHEIMKSCGRRSRAGTHLPVTQRAFERAGYKLIPVQVTAKTVVTLERDPAIKASYNYVVRVSGHILPIRKGKVLDWTAGRRHRVKEVYRVAKA